MTLNFQDHKDLFQDETTKVNYVLSYLRGSALDCFEPGLLDPIEPTWCFNFNLFSEELKANFSTFNPVREAEAELKGLCMQENHQVLCSTTLQAFTDAPCTVSHSVP